MRSTGNPDYDGPAAGGTPSAEREQREYLDLVKELELKRIEIARHQRAVNILREQVIALESRIKPPARQAHGRGGDTMILTKIRHAVAEKCFAVADALEAVRIDIETGMRARMLALQCSSGDDKWTTHDGTRVFVKYMSDSHLFYAIAKADRGEYPDSASRRAGVAALRREAFRRLMRVTEVIR